MDLYLPPKPAIIRPAEPRYIKASFLPGMFPCAVAGAGNLDTPVRRTLYAVEAAAPFGAGDVVSPSFTPPPNALLAVNYTGGGSTAGGPLFTVSGGGLNWFPAAIAVAQFDSPTNSSVVHWWLAETGSSPGSMQVTFHKNAVDAFAVTIAGYSYTGYDPLLLIGSSHAAVSTSTTPSGTLPQTPHVDSEILAAIGIVTATADGSTTLVAPGTGFTEIHDAANNGFYRRQTQFRRETTSPTYGWTISGSIPATPFDQSVFAAMEIRKLGTAVAAPTVTFLQNTTSTANQASQYTFASASTGTAADDRIIFAAIGWNTNDGVGGTITPGTCTIGGLPAKLLQSKINSGTGETVAIYAAKVPTGTTAVVVVNHSGVTVDRASCALYRCVGRSLIRPFHTAAGVDTMNLNIPDGGSAFAIAVAMDNQDGVAYTTTGVTENVDTSIEGGCRFAAGLATGLSVETGRTITLTNGGGAAVCSVSFA